MPLLPSHPIILYPIIPRKETKMKVRCSICGTPITEEMEKDVVLNFLEEFEITCRRCVDSIKETNNTEDDILKIRGL